MALNFTVFNTLAEAFRCPRCNQEGGTTQFFSCKSSENAGVSCKKCGYTELYEYRVLDGKYSTIK